MSAERWSDFSNLRRRGAAPWRDHDETRASQWESANRESTKHHHTKFTNFLNINKKLVTTYSVLKYIKQWFPCISNSYLSQLLCCILCSWFCFIIILPLGSCISTQYYFFKSLFTLYSSRYTPIKLFFIANQMKINYQKQKL